MSRQDPKDDPSTPPTVLSTVVAATDIPLGTVIRADQLKEVELAISAQRPTDKRTACPMELVRLLSADGEG